MTNEGRIKLLNRCSKSQVLQAFQSPSSHMIGGMRYAPAMAYMIARVHFGPYISLL
jgi:hypothetical protein